MENNRREVDLPGRSSKGMNDIRLLALDIDGTILTREKQLTDRTKAAIEAAADAGIFVALVTGRPFYGIPDELMSLKGLGYVISSNGAVTTNLTENRILRTAYLDSKTALEIIALPRAYDLVYAVFTDGIGYTELEPFERHLSLIDNPGLEAYIRKSRRITYDMDRLLCNAENGVENIWLIAHDQNERDKLNRRIRGTWDVQTVLTGKADIEIGSPLADKGMALSELASGLGVVKAEILAIGDSDNDIGMLKAAGRAVAMGNAEESVKSIAHSVTGSNHEDGAADVIEKLLIKDSVDRKNASCSANITEGEPSWKSI